MSEPVPHARFTDPLLKARSARRWALFTGTITNWWVLAGFLAALALYFVTPFLIPVAWAVILIATFAYADRHADAEWWVDLMTALGLQPMLAPDAPPVTPLLRSGDEREVLRGGEDARRQLLIFRSTDISKDGDGNKTKTHHDYTVVLMKDAVPAIGFLSAHEHRVSFMKFLGDDLRGSTLRGVEQFKVESVQLHERFELRSSTQDGTRARQIFKPTFIQWFTANGVPFEYEGGDLAVIVDRVLEHSEEFKFLLKRADEIHAAISSGAVPTPGA